MVSLKTMAAKRFYDYCYPKTKQLGSSFQQVFDEYGCLEAVDVEFNDENKRFTVQAKKHRPLLVDELNKDSSWILEPCTPVLPLGNPENLSHDIYPPIHMQDYYKETMVHNAQDSSKSRRPVYNIKRHMRNFASDHPDVYQPTYDRLIANESPVVISGKRGRKTMQGKSFNFDPTMLDTPALLLKDLLMEEVSDQTKSFVFNEDYTGGVLSMIPLSRSPYEHGVLVLPSSSLDGVSLKPFSVVTDSRNVKNEGGFTPTIVSGAEHKIPMKGCVLQTDCVYSAENDQQFFAARSQYNVMVGTIETDCVSCKVKNQQLRRIKFSSPEKIQQLSNLSSDRPLCSLSMNPHIHGEAIVATYDQHIYLWNATQHSNPVLDQQEGNSNVEEVYTMTSDGKSWLQVDFAAHPRQIFVADRKKVDVVDLRGSHTSSRLLFTPSDDRLQDEMVLCILSGAKLTNYSADTNEFQCIVATQNYLLLMDQRYCKEPLLEWSLSMRHPCQHLAAAILPTEGATSNFTNHLLLAANQTAQELHCYQYQSKLGVSRQPFSDGDILVPRPPVSVSLPRALGTMKDIRRALSAHPIAKFKRRVVTRLQQPVIGTSALGFLSSDGKVAAVVFQATSCSDLTYQFLTLCDPHLQYEQQNIVTSYSTFETQADGESVSDKTSEIYLNWAKHVTDGFIDEISDKKHESKLTSSKLSLNTHEAYRSLEPHPECLICKGATIFPKKEELASDPEENLPAFQDTELQSGQSIPDGPNHNPKFCRRCQINVKESATVLNFISSGRVKTTHEEDVFNFETTESENSVEDLNLINLDRAKDGVGRILVDTWDGLYSDLWEEMNKEKLLEEEAAKLEQRKNIFDLSAAVDEIPEDQQSDDELTSLFNETVISKTETLPSGHVTPVKPPTTFKPSIMNRKTPRKKMKFDNNSVEDLERSFSKSSLFQRDTSFLFDQNANALAVEPINSSIMNTNSPIIHKTTSSQNKALVLPNITSTAPKFTSSKNILPSNANTPVKKGKLKSHRSVGFL